MPYGQFGTLERNHTLSKNRIGKISETDLSALKQEAEQELNRLNFG